MIKGPEPQPGILDIRAYVGGEGTLTGHALASNENPLGAGEAAAIALAEGVERPHVYPDGGAIALRQAIADEHGLDPERIVCGNGSDELLALLCRSYSGAGCEVVYSAHGFLMYRICALAAGALPVAVPERELVADVDALIAAVGPRTKIVFLANPNNPTGSVLMRGELIRLLNGIPERVLVVIDAAYAEYAADPDYEDGSSLVEDRTNVVMTRTFSKIHGLAALRVGWSYCPPQVASVLNRVRGPFNCNSPGMAAAAAAVRDREHVEKSVAMNAENRSALANGLKELDITVPSSAGNFVLARFRDGDEAGCADSALRSAGVRVRRMDAYGLPESLRITVGTVSAVRDVLGALEKFREVSRSLAGQRIV